MDSSSQNNWLGISLSNPLNSSDPTSHLSLFSENARDPGGATEASMFTSGRPKLEDFLGGSSSVSLCSTELYGSELKTIADSFLRRGFSAEQSDAQKQQQQQRQLAQVEPTPKKSVDSFGQRTSIFRGVTRHRWTGRYEAHLWDNSCRREGQSRKGRQVYLGGYDREGKAARAYDLAALKYWGPTTTTNFPASEYEKEIEEMKNMTRQEFVASLRRKSSGFSRGASIYRGVTRHHQHGRWQARIGRVAGNRDLYLGTFSTQEEAAEAYDIAAIKFRGLNAVTNFDISRYDVKSVASSNLPIGGMSGKAKDSSDTAFASVSKSMANGGSRSDDRDLASSSSVAFTSQPSSIASTLSFAVPTKQDSADYWSVLGYQNSSFCSNPMNPNVTSALFQSSAVESSFQSPPSSFTLNFSSAFSGNESNNGFFHGGFVQQQTGGNSNSVPTAVPIGFSGGANSFEGTSCYGNWIGTSLLGVQPHAKPSLCQTPIFGME